MNVCASERTNTVARALTAYQKRNSNKINHYRQGFDDFADRRGVVDERADEREGRRKRALVAKRNDVARSKTRGVRPASALAEVSNVPIDASRETAARTPRAASSTRMPWQKVPRCVEAIFGAVSTKNALLRGRITIRGSTRRRGSRTRMPWQNVRVDSTPPITHVIPSS